MDHSETVVTATESGTRIERSRSYRTELDALFAMQTSLFTDVFYNIVKKERGLESKGVSGEIGHERVKRRKAMRDGLGWRRT